MNNENNKEKKENNKKTDQDGDPGALFATTMLLLQARHESQWKAYIST